MPFRTIDPDEFFRGTAGFRRIDPDEYFAAPSSGFRPIDVDSFFPEEEDASHLEKLWGSVKYGLVNVPATIGRAALWGMSGGSVPQEVYDTIGKGEEWALEKLGATGRRSLSPHRNDSSKTDL